MFDDDDIRDEARRLRSLAHAYRVMAKEAMYPARARGLTDLADEAEAKAKSVESTLARPPEADAE